MLSQLDSSEHICIILCSQKHSGVLFPNVSICKYFEKIKNFINFQKKCIMITLFSFLKMKFRALCSQPDFS